MTPDATPRIVSRHIHERQTAPSTAPVPKARPWRRGQAPKPHSGAPKAQGLTAAIAVAAPSLGPSIAPDDPVSLNATGANAPMNAFATSRIYTSLTDATKLSGIGTSGCCSRSRNRVGHLTKPGTQRMYLSTSFVTLRSCRFQILIRHRQQLGVFGLDVTELLDQASVF